MNDIVIRLRKPVELEAGKSYNFSIEHNNIVTIKEILHFDKDKPVLGKTIYDDK